MNSRQKPRGLKVYLGQIDNHDPKFDAIHLSDVIADVKVFNFKRILAYSHVQLVVQRPDGMIFAGKMGFICWMLSGRQVEIIDYDGRVHQRITPGWIFKQYLRRILPRRSDYYVVETIRKDLRNLKTRITLETPFDPHGSPVYLRNNLWFGARSGGSFSHSVGVINALYECYTDVTLLSTDDLPALNPNIKVKLLSLDGIKHWHREELVHAKASQIIAKNAISLIDETNPPNFIYQRSTLGNYSGLIMAQELNCPLVLEYNGSETWVAKYWSNGLVHENLFEEIETFNLRHADVVTVISRSVWQDAVERGVNPERLILVPNAVDMSRFHKDVSDEGRREKYGLNERTVGLFIGSFGPWHGVSFLIEAYHKALSQRPDLRNTTLILVGEGGELQSCRALAERLGLTSEQIIFTGEAPFVSAPEMLACADFYLSPQQPNPDGSEFFGSPTKLFEYMAMGKPIIASDLGQIGELLIHNHSALLFEPGNIHDLTSLLIIMFEDPSKLMPLANAALEDCMNKHSWNHRISDIVGQLSAMGS